MRAGRKPLLLSLLILWGLCGWTAAPAQVLVVVANPDTPALNEDILQKIYLGKVIEVSGRPVIPVNLAKGDVSRKAFMEQVMGQDDEKFVAYWTVRRYIGKGSPPREFGTAKEQLEYVRATPGAIGYLRNGVEIKQGLKLLLMKKP